MRGIIPDAILDRRDKVGFETPQRSWMKTLDVDVDAWLDGARAYPYIDVDALRPQLAGWLADRPSPLNHDLVWRLLNFSRWLEMQSQRLSV
jgi:asparagine synthase (glutamine-hydrolysing)